eukprot:gnl/MRDRNA2_/MRDRNA2_27694_c0_seq1.p1 gnl/MRDRNA2_/MRDRNA2_27694_c0~~gnl/MRDRNA2_/MRDRNA2_27694_c0_seq1.p1  ORF type:complete len:258 (-),score=45.64 gnl/MRDRNA2_/MRDRNA2_27694_c0_seq1:271-1044(-)
MLSNWAPRSENGQRRNPGIYSAKDYQQDPVKPKHSAFFTPSNMVQVPMLPGYPDQGPLCYAGVPRFRSVEEHQVRAGIIREHVSPEEVSLGEYNVNMGFRENESGAWAVQTCVLDYIPSPQAWKTGQFTDDESQTESPSTVAPDSSSDSDSPSGGASLAPPSSDDNLSSGDEKSEELPTSCHDDDILSSCDEKLEEPANCCRNARNCTHLAKSLTRHLSTELRDLQAEMDSLTEDLLAIKRMIPSRTSEGEFVFDSL